MNDRHNHHRESHAHTLAATSDARYLGLALALIVTFMVFEVVMAIFAQSLALLADAGHMLVDATALGASILAARLALRPPRGSMTFGFRRAEILSAQANGITLLVIAALVAFEAVQRLIDPPNVQGAVLIVVAGVGVLVNLGAVWLLARANRQSLNVEGSFQHILTDLYAFLGTLIAGVIIIATGFNRADSIASLVVVVLMLKASYGLLRATGRILLEAAPAGIDVDVMANDLASQADVQEVHDVHAWQITSEFTAISAHVLVRANADCHSIRRHLQQLLDHRYGITHATLQVDHVDDPTVSVQSLITSAQALRTSKLKTEAANRDLPQVRATDPKC